MLDNYTIPITENVGLSRDTRIEWSLSQRVVLALEAAEVGSMNQVGDDPTMLLLVGGRQKRVETRPSDEWSRFGLGVVAEMDLETGASREVFTWETPPDSMSQPDGSVVFKSATRQGGLVYLCTQTEVLVVDESSWELQRRISLSVFNDVHHVLPRTNGNLIVVSTGLDLVVEIDSQDSIVSEWNVAEVPTWERFDRSVDYRKVLTTKPHNVHPNFVFDYDGALWATRFEQKDAVCLDEPDRPIPVDIERPHDGVVVGDSAWFTTVDGHIVESDIPSRSIANVWDLVPMSNTAEPLGWTRGLSVLGDKDVLVGFSTLRVTKARENVRWVKKRFGLLESATVCPTHIARYDLAAGKMRWRRELESPRLDVIFSVLA